MPGALFGISAAMGEGLIAVGASDDSGTVMGGGAVYLFESVGGVWSQSARLESDDLAMSDFVGFDVAVDDGVVVAGAWGSDTKGNFAGAAYVFERDTGGVDAWGQRSKLLAPDGRGGDLFGYSVAVEGGMAAVGASFADSGGIVDRGAVYLFRKDMVTGDWGFSQKLVAPDANGDGQFGHSVAMDGERLVVGSVGADGLGIGAGAVYLYERDVESHDWLFLAKLEGSDVDLGDAFGQSVAIDGGRVVVGARRKDRGGVFAGAAYVFEEDAGGAGAWGESSTFRAMEPFGQQDFGEAVAVHGDLIVVGAIGTPLDGGDDAGSVHYFEPDDVGGWREALVVPGDVGGELFGSDVAVRVEGDGWLSVAGARGAGGDATPLAGGGRVLTVGEGGPPACPADIAEPIGVLNFFDVVAYIGLFNAGDPAADLTAPFGVVNFFDLSVYIGLFNAGCP